MLPFGGTFDLVQLKGSTLKKAFEHSVYRYGQSTGEFLQVGGKSPLLQPETCATSFCLISSPNIRIPLAKLVWFHLIQHQYIIFQWLWTHRVGDIRLGIRDPKPWQCAIIAIYDLDTSCPTPTGVGPQDASFLFCYVLIRTSAHMRSRRVQGHRQGAVRNNTHSF